MKHPTLSPEAAQNLKKLEEQLVRLSRERDKTMRKVVDCPSCFGGMARTPIPCWRCGGSGRIVPNGR